MPPIRCLGHLQKKQFSSGFSIPELLVVIALIAIVVSIGVPNVVNVGASARQSAIDLQEKNLNGIYRSLKAVTPNMPATKEGILAVLATNSQVSLIPPDTMEGPDGTVTLSFNSASDTFAYVAPADN